jgi:hypothetical protein
MKDLFAMIMSDPVLRTQFIEWAQRQTKAAEEDKLVRDLVADLRVPPSAQAPAPTERVTLAGVPVVTEYRGADQRGWVDPIPTDGWKPPGQAIIDAMTATTHERKAREG